LHAEKAHNHVGKGLEHHQEPHLLELSAVSSDVRKHALLQETVVPAHARDKRHVKNSARILNKCKMANLNEATRRRSTPDLRVRKFDERRSNRI